MFEHPDTTWSVAMLRHERLVARAHRRARLDPSASTRGDRVPAWLRRIVARCRWREQHDRQAMLLPARRGHARPLLCLRDGRPETAMRLRRARRHETLPHHRAVKRRAARL